jgi:hypothetical protein
VTLIEARRTRAHEAGPLALGLGIAHDTHEHDHDTATLAPGLASAAVME